MSAPPIDRRLRDLDPHGAQAGSQDASLLHARAIIRAIATPAPLPAAADARVLAALQRGPAASLRPPRLLLSAATLIGIVGTGLAAAAALRWMRTPPVPAPIPEAVAPVTVVVPKVHDPIVTTEPAPELPEADSLSVSHGSKSDFLRARLAINPKDLRYRPAIPSDFARAHAGEIFSWRVKICVSASGDVSEATLLDRVHPMLDRQVTRAIERWKYFPAQQAGHPINTCTALSYSYSLKAPGTP